MAQAAVKKIDVRPARTPSERRRFVDLPYKLYRGDPHWIAPLRMAQDLNTKSHPFYKTSDVEMFLAYREIKSSLNHGHILRMRTTSFIRSAPGSSGFSKLRMINRRRLRFWTRRGTGCDRVAPLSFAGR